MTASVSAGKQKGLEAVADSRGVIAAVAIDQRSALQTLFARAMEVAGGKCAGRTSFPVQRSGEFAFSRLMQVPYF